MRVLTVGCWDLLHQGHKNLFRRCQALGEVFIGVNSDRFMLEYKGLVPHDSEVTRLLNVRPFGREFLHDDRMEDDLRRFRPDVIVVGSDWARKDYHAQIKVSQEVLDSLNVSVMYVPATPGISSTQLRGHYCLCGMVDLTKYPLGLVANGLPFARDTLYSHNKDGCFPL